MHKDFGGETGATAQVAFTKVADSSETRSQEMGDVADALDRVKTAMDDAKTAHASMGPAPSKPAPLEPAPAGMQDTEQIRRAQHHSQQVGLYERQMGDRERVSEAETNKLEAAYREAMAPMKKAHGEPDPQPGGGRRRCRRRQRRCRWRRRARRSATAARVAGSTGSGNGNTGDDDYLVPAPTDRPGRNRWRQHHAHHDQPGRPGRGHRLRQCAGRRGSASGRQHDRWRLARQHPHVLVRVSSGAPTAGGLAGALGGGLAGGAAGIGGAVRGGGFTAVPTGAAAAGTGGRPIGASARTGGAGALGRSAIAGTAGSPTGRSGAGGVAPARAAPERRAAWRQVPLGRPAAGARPAARAVRRGGGRRSDGRQGPWQGQEVEEGRVLRGRAGLDRRRGRGPRSDRLTSCDRAGFRPGRPPRPGR